MLELNKKFVKFKLLYEEKEYAIIITRRAAIAEIVVRLHFCL